MAQRFEGKSLDEALDSATQTFGVERYQLTYHVLLEKRGFFGGVKRLVIEADVNPSAAPTAAQSSASTSAPSGPPRRERGGRGGGGGGRGRGNRGDRGGGGRSRSGNSRRAPRRRPELDDDLQPGDFEHFASEVPVPEQGSESEAAGAVRAWCARVFELAKFSLEIRTEENETQIIVRLYGRDARRFTDRHGELLDAVQVLANKALVGRRIEKEIELDCEAFKERRVEELGQKAREVADRVRLDGREELLPAMTPIERRIIHIALRDDDDVVTESRGEGFYKRVAIVPRPTPRDVEAQPAE